MERRTTAALGMASLGMAALALTGCAEMTTTGVPADGTTMSAEAHAGEGSMEPTAHAEEVATTLVGMTEEEAMSAAEEADLTFRVVEIDGEPQAATMDYRPDRVNVKLEDGEVTGATVG